MKKFILSFQNLNQLNQKNILKKFLKYHSKQLINIFFIILKKNFFILLIIEFFKRNLQFFCIE
jgi:hypothetical protein